MKKISNIIVIEDDFKKKEDIRNFLSSGLGIEKITIKESYQSGLRELIKNEYDLLLLDMSIPTWDKSIDEPGGNFEKFGGFKILKEITRKKKPIDTILITMFDDFGESDTSITLSQLNDWLKEEFPEFYKGAVYYNTREEKWKDDLAAFISRLQEK
jgi:DNA-binding NarL/FixJ family response regulator